MNNKSESILETMVVLEDQELNTKMELSLLSLILKFK